MKTEVRALADLKEYPENARINKDTVAALRDLIGRMGYLVPMVVTEDNVIVAGHARHKALTQQKVKEATCVIIKGNEMADEFRVLDNKISELSKWDNEKLDIELRGLEDTRDSMFPGLVKEAPQVTLDTNPVTKETMAEAEEKVSTSVNKNAAAQLDALVRVKCKGCGEEFQIKRWEIF